MKYLNALNLIPGVGSATLKKLTNAFPQGKLIWNAKIEELIANKIAPKLAEKIVIERKNIDTDYEWSRLEKENIKILTLHDPQYPNFLKEIPNCPYILYTKGRVDCLNNPAISIVGSRKYTPYGQQVAFSFSRELARAGITIISGMAIGIDTFSHQGALSALGQTIAVLGNGLDDISIYPRNNFNLSREIIETGGLLLSEYPPGTSAGPMTFPARNRIIAGLTLGTLVVEASENSGALITAQMALEYNREVLAVPGSIFSSQSAGTNKLLKQGAKVVTSVADILEELAFDAEKKNDTPKLKNPETEEEKIILKFLSSDPTHIDNIAKMTKLKTSTVSSALVMMELKGWVKNIGGQNYIIL